MRMRRALLFWVFILVTTPVLQAQQPAERSSSRVTIAGETFYVHTVKPGETFYSLGKLYDTDEETIRARNPIVIDGLRPGQVLKIPIVNGNKKTLSARKMNKLFDTHVVNQGETAYSISKRYGISLATLMEDNPGFDPAHLSIGQKVNVRIESQGEASGAEIEQELDTYKEALDNLSPRFTHHVVEKGETLYSLSKSTGLPIDTITKYNATELRDGLKLGSILKLPLPPGAVKTGAGATAGSDVHGDTSGSLGVGSGVAGRVSGDHGTGTAPQGPGWPSATGEQRYTETAGNQAVDPAGFPASYPAAVPGAYPFSAGGAVRMKQIDITAPIRVAVLLPLRVGSSSDRRYLEFYQGVLLALDELKSTGVSTQVDLFNTGRSEAEVRDLLRQNAVQQADLIIGPVYDDCFAPVAVFAAERGIPVVSPLASMNFAGGSLMFEAAPLQSAKYAKLQDEFSPSNNVVVVSATSNNDAEMLGEINSLLPASARKVTYTKGGGGPLVEGWLNMDKENVFVVLSENEQMTEEILASISSVQNSRISRGLPSPSIKVVGSSRWARFQNLDKNLFFKLNLRYTTNYHADRGNERVANFDRRYVAAFSSLPSMYAYRGYDVAKLFVGAIKLHGNEFVSYLNDRELPLLQTPYRFVQQGSDGKYSNNDWAKVCYNSNYTIDVQ